MRVFPLSLLPRRCPRCGELSIIGHGRRRKQAHDERHDWIWVRRGLCRPCGVTFTILPSWSPPWGHYSLRCRQQSWESTCKGGGSWEQAIPHTNDPDRLPDPAKPLGLAEAAQLILPQEVVLVRPIGHISTCSHHPRLGLAGSRTYSAAGGILTMIWAAAEAVKQRVSLLDYLQSQTWKPVRRISRGRLMGLCPLHREQQPSFLVDPAKNLFYCYGCGHGGDIIRFVELYHDVGFGKAMELLRNRSHCGSLLEEVTRFYQVQLQRHPEAATYLQQRGIHQPQILDELKVGYAPGRCLRHWLISLGYSISEIQQAGLVNAAGLDTFSHRVVFPLEANLYGRSIGNAAPHRFLPGGKGGLYGWERVKQYREVILVEGLFDLAVLWQAGFPNTTCAMGSHLNARQLRQLCDGVSRSVYVAFDSDANDSGQQAAQRLALLLVNEGVVALRVQLPEGHDPNSLFVHGGDSGQFQQLLERALP